MQNHSKNLSQSFTIHSYPKNKSQISFIHRSFIILLYFIAWQFPFFITIVSFIHALVHFKPQIIIFLLVISLVQSFFKKSKWVIQFTDKYIQPLHFYKKFQKIYDQQIPSQQKTLFAMHPHGVFALSMSSNMNIKGDSMQNMVGLSSRFMHNMPITGLLMRLWGVRQVDPKSMHNLMKKQHLKLGIMPGGFEQAAITSCKQLRVYINNRKGFIKYALRYGYTIRPVLIFKQHHHFWTFDYLRKWRLMLTKIKLPGVLFWSQWGFFVSPNMQMITVTGRGIKCESSNKSDISDDQINRIHKEYIQEIKRLYDKYGDLNRDQKENKIPLIFQ